MKRTRKSARNQKLLKLLPAAIAVASAAHADPPKPPPKKPAPGPPKQPKAPPIPKFVDTNVVRIRALKLSPRLPKAGDTVTVTMSIMNESLKPLTKVEWKLSGSINATGSIASIASHATQTVSKTFTAKAGAISIVAAVDPAQRLHEPSAHLKNNTVAIKTAAFPAASSPWVTWARAASDHIDDFFDLMKKVTSVDAEINGSTLKVKKLKLASYSTTLLKKKMTDSGIPTNVATAFVDCWVNAYRLWAIKYTAIVPSAYPSFTAWPGPKAGPMPNVPFSLSVGGGATSNPALSVGSIEKDLQGRLTTQRRKEKDASSSIHHLAEAFVGGFDLWLGVQQVTNVIGQGPVPAYAPPYVPVGPVVMGDNIGTPGHSLD